jgi:hypothetical protein
MLGTSLHLLVGLLGFSLLYAALFLHENEEGQLQNRLEKLWVAVDDLSKVALSKQAAFLQQVSAMANSALNKVFGTRLFSVGAVSASLSLSMGCVSLFLTYVSMNAHSLGLPHFELPFLIAGLVSFLVGLSPLPFRYLGLLWIPASILFLFYFDRGVIQASGWRWWITTEVLPTVAVLFASFFSDVLFVAMTRWCLRKSSELTNGWKIASLTVLNGCLGLGLISPLIWGVIAMTKDPYGEGNGSAVSAVFGASNLVTGAIALLFVVLALAAIAHLALWPILERPIYSLQRFGVARQPKLLAAASVTCLLFAWPNSPLIHGITKLIHGG